MGVWDYTVDKLTPEIRAEMTKRIRQDTQKLREALSDLQEDEYLTIEVPEGRNPQTVKMRIKSVAASLGKHVAVQVIDDRARVCLTEPPPEGQRRGGRPKKVAT